MTKTTREDVKEHIEIAIERARDGVSEHIDEIDRRLRSSLDFRQMAGDHAPQLLAAGAALCFLIGLGAPRLVTRGLQLGVPLFLAVQIMKKKREAAQPELSAFDLDDDQPAFT